MAAPACFLLTCAHRCWADASLSRCRCGFQRGKRDPVFDALPLNDSVNKVGRDIPKNFVLSAGPPYGHLVHRVACSQSEMQAQVILGKITASALHFAELRETPSAYSDTGANYEPDALASQQLEQHAMIAILAMVQQ